MRALLSVAGILIAGALFFMYTVPAYDEVSALSAKIGEYDQALNKSAELQKLKESLLKRYNALDEASKEKLHKMLPDHVDNVRLILDIDSLATSFGMPIQNVVINSSEDESAERSAVKTISTEQRKYDSLTFKFSTKTTYDNFVRFMEALQGSLRIVDPVSLTVSSEKGSAGVYEYDVTIRTYWLR